MKVALITLHRVYNYGSVLQAYASQYMLEKNGCECTIIDYITPQRTFKRLLLKDSNRFGKIKRMLYFPLKSFSLLIKRYTFNKFINKYLHLTKKRFVTFDDLLKINSNDYDAFIVGSDQVWNTKYNEGIDKGFFLQFVNNSKKKLALSSSFGIEKFDNDDGTIIKNYLKDFYAISVREKQSLNLLNSIKIKGECLIDPTLMVTKDFWKELSSKRLVKDNYLLLILLYNEDNGATNAARKIADAKGLKLVKISWQIFKPDKIDILFSHRSPKDFLSLVQYSSFIVTNSFHCVAFAINFNKQFIVFKRNEFNNRIQNLLSLFNIDEHLVDESNYLNIYEKNINFDYVNEVLVSERSKASEFIKKNLKRSIINEK